MASAVIVMLVLTWGGNRFAWASPEIVAMIGSALALGVAFVWHARRASEPFLPIPLLSGSVVPYAMAAGGCAIGAMIGLTVHMPLYYEVVYGLTASEAGLALIPLVAVSVLGAWIAGRTMMFTKHYKRAAIGGVAVSTCSALALALLTPMPLWQMLAVLSLLAVGLGTVFPVSVVSIQNAVPRAQVGTATGAMNFFRSLMASFTVAAFTAIRHGASHRRAARHRRRRHDRGLPLCVRRGCGPARLGRDADAVDGRASAGGAAAGCRLGNGRIIPKGQTVTNFAA